MPYAWRDELLKLLRQFEDSTPGSHLEEKPSTLVWHYRRADPEFGEWRAKQLLEELAFKDSRPQWTSWAKENLIRLSHPPPSEIEEPTTRPTTR